MTTQERWQERDEFSRRERKLFRATMEVQAPSGATEPMQQFIMRRAVEFGATAWIKDGNVYAVKGEADVYPCIVAHSDQVHDAVPQERFMVTRSTKGDWFAWDREAVLNKEGDKYIYPSLGIGGDDKVGVYIALNALRTQSVMKIAVFRDEEIGCVGAGLADMTFFTDVAFALECDRRGNDDFVDRISGINLFSDEFRQAIKPMLNKRGFTFSWGAMTDVEELADNGIGVAVANMSCGYYAPHSNQEYCVEKDVIATQLLVTQIIEELGDRRWEQKHTKKSYRSNYTIWGADEGTYFPSAIKDRLSATASALKARGYTYSDDFCTWIPPVDMLSDELCTCTGERSLVWDEDKMLFLCENCGLTYRSNKGTTKGACTCGGEKGYRWDKEKFDWLCNIPSCNKAKPRNAPTTPWTGVPLHCTHCGVGNARLSWNTTQGVWWCMECLGYSDGAYIDKGNEERELKARTRLAFHRKVTSVLKMLKGEIHSIDFSDPAIRRRVEDALKDESGDALLARLLNDDVDRYFFAEKMENAVAFMAPLNGGERKSIALPASTGKEPWEEDEDVPFYLQPAIRPETCSGCTEGTAETLAWDSAMGMWMCIECDCWTAPIYAD